MRETNVGFFLLSYIVITDRIAKSDAIGFTCDGIAQSDAIAKLCRAITDRIAESDAIGCTCDAIAMLYLASALVNPFQSPLFEGY